MKPINIARKCLLGAVLLFLMGSARILPAQTDLYIQGEFMMSGIQDTVFVNGDIIYDGFGNGKICMAWSSQLFCTGNFINQNLSDEPFYVDPNPLLRSRGTVNFSQGFPQEIGGNGSVNFHQLLINKVLNTQFVHLTNDISLTDKLILQTGDLNADSSGILFSNRDTAAYIVGETDLNQVFGSIGYIQTKRFSSVGTPISPAGIGLTFSGLQDSVFVRRYFTSQPNAGAGGIERFYQVRSNNPSIQSAAISSTYLDTTETNGYGDEANFKLFVSSDQGSSWTGLTSTVDSLNDVVSATQAQGVQSDTSLFTIASSDCSNPPVDSIGNDTSFCDGDFVLLNAGSGPGYRYLWNTGDTTQTLAVAQTDTLSVTLTDAAGCATSDTIIVTRNPLPFVGLTDSVSACPGDFATLDAQNPGFSFLWSTSDTTQSIAITHADTNQVFASIWVVVTDSNGCQNNDTAIFRHDPPPFVDLGGNQSLCGGSNTLLDAAFSGPSGNVGVSYLWNTGATSSAITVGTTGNYSVQVTNTWSCTATDTVSVDVAPALAATISGTNITCNGASDGSVDLTVSGGTLPYSFSWNTTDTTEDLSGLAPGTYSVTITDSLNCTANTSIAITQPAALVYTMSASDVTCFGDQDGTAAVATLTGGTTPFSFLWSNSSTQQNQTSLGPGTFSVTVSDSNGCSFTDSVSVTEPPQLTLIPSALNNPGCASAATGSIDIDVAGGTPGYTYLWSTGATTQDLNALTAGTYSITATDQNLCSVADTFTLTEPTALVLSESHGDLLCNGDQSGIIDLTVSGGIGPYGFQWSNGPTTEDLSGLSGGTYSVTVTDANNCQDTLSVSLVEPTAIALSLSAYDAACGSSNGSAAVSVSGGTPGYNFFWPHNGSILDSLSGLAAGIYQVRVTDGNGCLDSANAVINNAGAAVITLDSVRQVSCNGAMDGYISTSATGGVPPFTYLWNNGGTTPNLTNIGPGTYDLTLTAADGCQAFASVVITEPPALTSTGIETDLLCFGGLSGAIDLIPGGGVGPYSYLWNTGATSEDLTGLPAGGFQVTITDANNCTLTDSFTLSEPAELTLAHLSTDASCSGGNDGAIDLLVNGGTPGYSFAWSNGQNSEDQTGLAAGTYSVIVTDQNGCQATDTSIIDAPSPIAWVLTGSDVTCNGTADGTIDLTVSEGTSPYSFNWNTGATTEDLLNIGPGNYSVTVTDSNGCQISDNYTVTEPPLLVIDSLVATDIHCGGANTGTANVFASGGTSPFTYLWNNGSTQSSLVNLTAGNYSVTVTDSNACTVSGQVDVIEPPTLSVSGVLTDVSCQGQADGFIQITPFGGTAPYSYTWNTGDNTRDLIGITTGTYILTMTDVFGCTVTDTFMVEEGDSSMDASFLVATYVNSGDTVYFVELSLPEPTQVLWDFGDGFTSDIASPFHIYANNPNEDTSRYEVKMTASNAWCTDSLKKTVNVINVGNKTEPGSTVIPVGPIQAATLYPNPTLGAFQVQIDLKESLPVEVTVMDQHGRTMTSQNKNGSDTYTFAYDLKNLSAGLYLVRVSSGGYRKTLRLILF